ncbi:MAG: hypothetical protein JXB48_15755 [Candidatus Latescibacteria bacterium]|nr:hypothetical protein [Candidatus Latescibacterota bacterium]
MKHAISFVILTILFTGIAPGEQTDSQKMSEDVRTMARLIGGELRKEFSGNYYFGAGMGKQRCNGVYLRDYGVVFMTSVQFPIFDYDEVTSEKEPGKSDLWEKYQNDTEPVTWGIVDKKNSEKIKSQQITQIKQLESFLSGIMCTYAGNLRMLSPNEYITIAVRGERDFGFPTITFTSKSNKNENSKIENEVETLQFSLQNAINEMENKSKTIENPYGESEQYLIARIKKKDLSGNCAEKIEFSFY